MENDTFLMRVIIIIFYLNLQLRIMDRNMSPLTPLHLTILEDLVDLSISTYAQVFPLIIVYSLFQLPLV